MRACQIIAGLALSAVQGFVALMCCGLLFGTICGQSAWDSPQVSLATKAWLVLGILVPAVGGLFTLYWGMKPPEY